MRISTSLLTIAIFLFSLCGSAQESAETAVTQAPTTQEQSKPDEPEKEKLPPKGVIHLQEIKDVPQVHADQNCKNYSWAASLQAVLEAQKVELKQGFWADRYYGGDLCLDEIGAPDDLIKKAEGEYTLDDGRHVRIEMKYFAGVPADTAALLVPIMTDELLILFVDGTAEVLTGAMWDEYHSNRGERMIDLKELHLLNPLLEGDKQKVILDATGDEIGKISGFMKVRVVEANPQYWPK